MSNQDDEVNMAILIPEQDETKNQMSAEKTNNGRSVDTTEVDLKLAENWDVMMNDGQRRIDFIISWSSTETNAEKREEGRAAREIFEKNLELEGLQLEYDIKEGRDANFVKVHAPWDVLTRYTEFMKLRMPMKETEMLLDAQSQSQRLQVPEEYQSYRVWDTMSKIISYLSKPFQLKPDLMPKKDKTFTCAYARDKEYLFKIPDDRDSFYDVATRIQIVDFILRRKSFSEEDTENYSFGLKKRLFSKKKAPKRICFSKGIRKMIADGHYSGAYPLHEGSWHDHAPDNDRKLLYTYWANWKNFLKIQPLDHIRAYFGAKIAMYFAWLGFYTAMLVPASLCGIIIFIYGLVITNSSTPNRELCESGDKFKMCPLCDVRCQFWELSSACYHVKASRVVDNRATVAFAIFMSLWGTLFLEFWKRKEAVVCYKWDLTTFFSEEEPPRPEFLSRLANSAEKKQHPITGMMEPHLPFWRKRAPIMLASVSTMLLLVAVAVGCVIGVIAYRIAVLAALYLRKEELFYQNATLVTTATAAVINLVIIVVLNIAYNRLAFWLTDLECRRTQTEYDNSITLKLFTLQFVNYYSSIIYIAFFKGKFVGPPNNYNVLLGGRPEECGPGGCLIELTIQLAIIMVGKQLVVNNLVEVIIPKVMPLLKKLLGFVRKKKRVPATTSWEKDLELKPADTISLFYEYLEMVLQFGFLTLFVAAFPLAPLFAFLNNIIEIRLDANKFVRDLQRTRAERVADIGVWYSVLYGISRLGILTNAFIIALTADFLPRVVYRANHGSTQGFWDGTLSTFKTADFPDRSKPIFAHNVTTCRYRDYRDENYEYSTLYWQILAARFIFIVVFENVVIVITSLIAWMIPDIPRKLKDQIHREAYITNEVILKTELQRAGGHEVGRPTTQHGSDGDKIQFGAVVGRNGATEAHQRRGPSPQRVGVTEL